MLLPVMLAAAGSLAYYVYSYSEQLAARERRATLDTMGELAKEKLIGIQTAIAEADRQVFDAVDFSDLASLGQSIASTPHRSATILSLDQSVVSGGSFRKANTRDDDEFTRVLTSEVIPDLELGGLGLNQTRYLHQSYGDQLYLFSASRVFSRGRIYFVVLEFDLSYLVAEVFSAFFDVRSPNRYQVMNQQGELIYGNSFTGVPKADVVELRFPQTLTQWRLGVSLRDAGALASGENRQKTVELVLIGVSMTVIFAGLLIMFSAMRRERRLSDLKSEFITNVSHELKTPLSIISMFGELLSMGRTKSPEQAAEYAEIIRRESGRLSSLIDNVLDFAKIERGVQPYTLEPDQSLAEVVERAVEICRPRLEQAKMELKLKINGDLPATRLDPNAMVLTILNLVDNAIKYAFEGECVELTLGREGDFLCILVRDFGPGIASEELQSVFDRFYRAKSVRLKPVRGSGIGLSLVKHIVEAHGGVVSVESMDPGVQFRIQIPIAGSIE